MTTGQSANEKGSSKTISENTEITEELSQCDELLNFIDKRYARQKLNPPSDSSDASRDNHDTHRQPRSHKIRKTATLHSIAISYHRHPIISIRYFGWLDSKTNFSLLKSCLRRKALQSIRPIYD
ncbi:hypothetical protein OSTOST_11867 [Ostertagia ostertagi]